MYQDLKKSYWWPDIKSDVAKFVVACLVKNPILNINDLKDVNSVRHPSVEMG